LVSSRKSSKVKYFGSYEECDRYYNLYELNVTRIDSKDNLWEFIITLSSYQIFQGGAYYKGIGFAERINPNQSNLEVASIGLLYKNDSIYDRHGSSCPPIFFHKLISLGTNSYNDIYEITFCSEYLGPNLWVKTIFYSVKQGLVGFRTSKNDLWSLVSVTN